MESEQEVQYEIKKDLNQMKEKKDWNFLSDIESLLKLNLEKKLRCIVFDTETTGIYHTKDHILELAAIEIVNFELTGQIMHIYIEPRVNISKSAQEINNIKYDDYQNFWKYYNQDTKSKLQHLLHFIETKLMKLSQGIQELIDFVEKTLKTLPKEDLIEYEDRKIYTLEDEEKWTIKKEDGVFIVSGKAIQKLMGRVNIEDNESMYYLQKSLKNMGIDAKLKEMGVCEGDTVILDDWELEWYE